jgi:hypothetical protein
MVCYQHEFVDDYSRELLGVKPGCVIYFNSKFGLAVFIG